MLKHQLIVLLVCAATPASAQPASNQRTRLDNVVTFAPAPGAPVVGATKPPWCGKAGDTSKNSAGEMQRLLGGAKDRGWNWGQIEKLSRMLCMNPDDPKFQEQTGQIVQAWVNQTGLDAATATSHITARIDESWGRQRTAACASMTVSGEAVGREREVGVAMQDALGCGKSAAPFWFDRNSPRDKALGWYIDDEENAPQILTAYWVLRCLPDPFRTKIDDSALARYASCGVDARRLDEKQFESELASSGWNDYAKVTAREHHAVARRVAARYLEEAKALGAKDPDYQNVLLDGPEKAWSDWVALMATQGSAVRAALVYGAKFEPAGKGPAGCKDALRAALATWMQSRGAKTVEEAKAAMSSSVGYVLSTHLMACLASEGLFHSGFTIQSALSRSRPARGPRTAVHNAAIDAIAAVTARRPRFPLKATGFGNRGPGPMVADAGMLIANGSIGLGESEKGVVKSVTRAGDWSVIAFRTESWQEPTYDCKATNRINAVDFSTGRVYYEENCTITGRRTVSKTPASVRLITGDAGAIKPGLFVVFRASTERGETRRGIIQEVWSSKEQQKLVAFRGFALE